MYDLTMYDVQLIAEIDCKGTKIFRITQVLNTKIKFFLHNSKKNRTFAAKSCIKKEFKYNMEQLNRADYIEAVKAIKEAIQISRYRAAKLVNKEVLALYYAVGRYISLNSRHASYGSSALRVISDQLQQEMPGLKGFSESSLKRMRKFYEDWSELIENRPPVADDLNADIIPFDNQHIIIRPLTVDEFTPEQLQQF